MKKFTRLGPLSVKMKNGVQIRKEHIFFDLGPTYLMQKAFETASVGHFTKEPLIISDAKLFKLVRRKTTVRVLTLWAR